MPTPHLVIKEYNYRIYISFLAHHYLYGLLTAINFDPTGDYKVFATIEIAILHKKYFVGFSKNILGVTAAMTNNQTMTAIQILKAMDEMDNGERIKLLKVLSVKHFGRKPTIVLKEFGDTML